MADKITFTTPRGIAVYPRLDSPDTKFDDNGTYKADLRIKVEDAQPLLDKLRKIYRDHVGKALPKSPEKDSKNAFYYIELDDDGEETGFVVFKMRVKNKITKKGDLWDRRPVQFDARGRPINKPKRVGGGSTLRVTFEVYLWQNSSGGKGMSLQPEAVQIIDLKEYEGKNKSASEYGFGEEEGYSDDQDNGGFQDETGDDDTSDDDTVSADEDDDDY